MFENLLYQNASSLIASDIKAGTLPSSILLSGPRSSGKLTCALEIARILSCTGDKTGQKGNWLCDCPGCRQQKELSAQNIILAGPRDCSLEILAAGRTLLDAGVNNYKHLKAALYLYIRAVKKLLLRFSPILWEGDKDLSRVSPLVEEINDYLEMLDPKKDVPENTVLEDITSKILKAASKLEKSYMYDSLPIDHVRRASFWAHLKSNEGKKVLIIENAERMNDSCRNALLKILEEPPSDTLFILTTCRRGAVMPTILSRVRTYNFVERTKEQQEEVIERVFHDNIEKGNGIVQNYLYTFLPVSPELVREHAFSFYKGIKENHLLNLENIVNECGKFEPRSLFVIFLQALIEAQKTPEERLSGEAAEIEAKNIKAVTECYNSVTVYNLKPLSALETLYRELAQIRKMNQR